MLALWLSTAALAGPNTLLVGVSSDAGRAAVRQVGPARCWAPLCIVEAATPARTAAALRAHPGVRYVEHDARMPVVATPPPAAVEGTEACPDLWELDQIGVEDAWALAGRGADAPVVAIQDTGFLLSHQDLGDVSGQFDYGDVDTVPEVAWSSGIPSHGTFIAGMVASPDDNAVGRVGVLPEGRLNLQKIADSSGALYFSYAVAAMLDLADGDLGVRVLNYSIASSSTTASFNDAIAALGDAGILLVAAAANCGSGPDCWDGDNDAYPLYPANSPGEHVLSVAGSTRDDDLNPYSHYGSSTVDLAAPGVELCSLGVLDDTDTYTSAGTSYATPLVAATAALVWSAWPDLEPGEVARLLRASVVESAGLEGKVRSDGRLSASRALLAPLPTLEVPSSLSVDGVVTLPLVVGSRAAGGDATVLVVHGDGLSVPAGPAGWSATSLHAGDTVTLPDAGAHTLAAAATLLAGPLPEGGSTSVLVELRGEAVGVVDATVRLVATSAGVDYLNAPYNSGVTDETGFLAETVQLDVRSVYEAPAGDTGSGDGADGADGGGDGAPDGDTGEGQGESAGIPSESGGGCAAAPLPGGAVAALLPLLAVWRRRREG